MDVSSVSSEAPGAHDAHEQNANTEHCGRTLGSMQVHELKLLAKKLHVQVAGNKGTLIRRVRYAFTECLLYFLFFFYFCAHTYRYRTQHDASWGSVFHV